MRNPSILPNLLEEIKALKSKTKDMNTAAFTPHSLPYTMATIYESLRLYPPVPFELKQCMKPEGVTLPDLTFLPFQSIIVWCPWAMNRSPEIWPSPPPDETATTPSLHPEDFQPLRWLKADKDAKTKTMHLISRPAHEFPVFNGGSRTCLGKKMAETVMCQVVACLVERYEFKMDRMEEKVSMNSLTLPMEGGLEVYVTRRVGMEN